MAQHVFVGTTPPAFAPSKVGQHYVDTAAGETYISVGTSSAGDWKIMSQAVNSVNGQVGVVVLTSSDVGAQPADITLTALAAYNTNGIVVQTAADTFMGRSIAAGAGISISNGDGVSGNPTVSSTITQYTDEMAQDAVGGAMIATASILPAYNDSGNQLSWSVIPSGVDHEALGNYQPDKHIDHTSVQIATAAGSGLSGGGDISATRNLVLDINGLTANSNRPSPDNLLPMYSTISGANRKYLLRDFVSQCGTTSDFSFFWSTDFILSEGNPLTQTGAGTGNSTQVGSYGMDNVERAIGVSQTDTGTTATGRRTVASALNTLTTGLGRLRFGARHALEQLSNGTDTFTVYLGFINQAGAGDQNSGAYFRYTHGVNGGRWQAVTAAGGGSPTRTAVDTGVLADTLYSIFEVEIDENTTNAKFYINGVLVATISTDLPPTSTAVNVTFGFGWKIEKSVGTAAVSHSTDWAYFELGKSTAR